MKKRVGILYGGPSSEHEVSLKSAQNVLANIDIDLYEPIGIFITKQGSFIFGNKELSGDEAIQELKHSCDVVFPVLHGAFGEDGTLQKLLEDAGVSFVGSGSAASRNAMDKHTAHAVFVKYGLRIPETQLVRRDTPRITLTFPVILKPVNEGSSVGLSIFTSHEAFGISRNEIFSQRTEMLAQEFIIGREFTCGVLEIEGKPVALPASEIILKTPGLFSYETKYTAGACTEVTPAIVPKETMKRIQDTALRCHEALGCKSISRTDMIMSEDGTIYVLETNTLPGMTKTSFIPAQAEAYGLSMKDLTTTLLESAKN